MIYVAADNDGRPKMALFRRADVSRLGLLAEVDRRHTRSRGGGGLKYDYATDAERRPRAA